MSDAASVAKSLPVHAHRDEIVAAVKRHQVVVLEGPTGSGKTTQVPQMLLEAGITDKTIGMTQPRRIAAVSVCWRIAEELGVEVGDEVGYTIRFDDQSTEQTQIRVMTDGILLQEAREQPDFDTYGVIIIDEAHERSLNIDFLLGLLHRAVRHRADLRVVISSATIDPEQFVRFFRNLGTEVPRLSINARPYPVDVRYEVPQSSDPDDVLDEAGWQIEAICRSDREGHVLVFCSGEAAIRGIESRMVELGLDREVAIVPLYGALRREDQEAVFSDMGKRKVVLSTNIAETSITVAGVRFVVDTGVAKVPRVHPRTGVRTLLEEPISRASAAQRAGRAGRTAPGVAIRLYPREHHDRAPEFTTEAILRLDLREVVLRLIDVGVHDVEEFPFPTPPPARRIKAAVDQLQAMGAIDERRRLTPIGRRMTPFPLDPRTARMVIEAADRFPEVVDEVLMVAAWLSGKRPFLYPKGEERAARNAQAAFAHPLGDAPTAVNVVWSYLRAKDRESFCKRHYLDPDVMAFLVHAHEQLRDIATSLEIQVGTGGSSAALVQCVAAGFADQILVSQGRVFQSPDGVRCSLHPASSLFHANVRFVVSTELIVLRRTYATFCSALKPEWIEAVNPTLADRLKLRKASDPKQRKGALRRQELPDSVTVGDVSLAVVLRRGRVQIDVHQDQLDTLRQLLPRDIRAIPGDIASLRSRVVIDGRSWLTGVPLSRLLTILPKVPLPTPGQDLQCRVPEGELHELDRDEHVMRRFVDNVVTPSMPTRGRIPGWAALITNGAGGFWWAVTSDIEEAVEQSLASLDVWEEHCAADPVFAETLAARRAVLGPLLDSLHSTGRRGGKGRRRRGQRS